MPLTVFYCPECEKEFSRFRSLSQIPEGAACPECKAVVLTKGAAQTSSADLSDDNLPDLT